MSNDVERFSTASGSLKTRLLNSSVIVFLPFLFFRFIQLRRSWRFVQIAPHYVHDFDVLKYFLRLFWRTSWKSTKGKLLVLTSMGDGEFQLEGDLKGINIQESLSLLAKLETFLAIYELELMLALNIVPHTEMADELDSIIGRYRSEGNALLLDVERLDRRRQRRNTQMFVSGLFALFSIILFTYLAQSVDLSRIVTPEFLGWVGVFLIIVGLLTFRTWWSFPPVLQSNASPARS